MQMNVAALSDERLTLVTLFGETDLSLLQSPAFGRARQVTVRSETPAQRNVTASRIDAAIAEADRAVLLVAHGAGCLAAAWWARLSPRPYVARVAGALMIAPDGRTPRSAGFASPLSALPFPSIVVGADDASQQLAGEWGSRLIDGPLPVAGRSVSSRFQAMMSRFTSAIVDHDVRMAERLIAAIGDR
jgi:pimeloyl-ACP methyl ester carboxylesterase